MIYGLPKTFDDFVSLVKRHDHTARMEDFSIDINEAMAREIDESLLVMPRDKYNYVEGYSLCGMEVAVWKQFGRLHLIQPEPPLIWFRYELRHGKLYTIDESGNLIPAVESPKFKVEPYTPPKDEWQIVIN